MVHYGARVEGARGEVLCNKRLSFIQSVVDPGGCCMCKDELEDRGRRDAAHYPLLSCLFPLLQHSHCNMVGTYHILVEVTSEECLVEDQVGVIVQHAVDVGEVMTVICGPGVCLCVCVCDVIVTEMAHLVKECKPYIM